MDAPSARLRGAPADPLDARGPDVVPRTVSRLRSGEPNPLADGKKTVPKASINTDRCLSQHCAIDPISRRIRAPSFRWSPDCDRLWPACRRMWEQFELVSCARAEHRERRRIEHLERLIHVLCSRGE